MFSTWKSFLQMNATLTETQFSNYVQITFFVRRVEIGRKWGRDAMLTHTCRVEEFDWFHWSLAAFSMLFFYRLPSPDRQGWTSEGARAGLVRPHPVAQSAGPSRRAQAGACARAIYQPIWSLQTPRHWAPVRLQICMHTHLPACLRQRKYRSLHRWVCLI